MRGAGFEVRAVDATTVKAPGKTDSRWRIHDRVRLPSLVCDHFRVTETEVADTGASFRCCPVVAGDGMIGDRGGSTAGGVAQVDGSGGPVLVRVHTGSLRGLRPDGRRFDLLAAVSALARPGPGMSLLTAKDPRPPSTDGRAVKKSDAAIAPERLCRKAEMNQSSRTGPGRNSSPTGRRDPADSRSRGESGGRRWSDTSADRPPEGK